MRRAVLFMAILIAFLGLAGTALAQSSFITTTFTSNNGGSSGWVNLFDVNILSSKGLEITAYEVNSSSAINTTFAIAVYITPNTYVGKDGLPSAWTQVSQGNGVGVGRDLPTPVDVADFILQPGKYGMAIHYMGTSQAYTNGTGTGPTGNQVYTNADISLTCGMSRGGFFTGTTNTPRVWNGTIYYRSAASAVLVGAGTPTPGSTYSFSLLSANEPTLPYTMGSSLGTGPILLGNRKLGLSIDALLTTSVGGTLPMIFRKYSGTLDTSGRASAALAIPKIAALKGLKIYTAYLTLDTARPHNIGSISNTVDFQIQ